MSDFSINLFYSYSHADEGHRIDMEKYLTLLRREGVLKEWYDRKILPGQKITEVIHQQLIKADIIIFLVSIDFLNSDSCHEEWELAKSLAKVSKKSLISIIVRDCPWSDFDNMSDYLVLPTDGKSVSSFSEKDSAWSYVYSGIKAVVEDIRSTFELKDEFKNKISLLEFCSQTNEAFTLNDLFVFPNLIKPSDSIEDELQLRNSNDILKENKR
jgi:TIR domain-containing protein